MGETLDTLAEKIVALTAAMGRGFEAVDTRFDAMDTRFAGVEDRLDRVEARLDSNDTRFVSIDQRFDGIDQRFDELKSELRTRIEAVDAKVGLVLEKVTDLTVRDARHSAVHVRHEQVLDNHELRLRALESNARPTDR
jgi:chromosome segregation ATPase